MNTQPLTVMTAAQLMAIPEPDRLFTVDDDGVTLHWGGYPYFIEWGRLATPLQLLSWIAHVGEKTWAGTTPARIRALIDIVSQRNGWDVWGAA